MNKIETYISIDFLESYFEEIPNKLNSESLLKEENSLQEIVWFQNLFFKYGCLLYDDDDKLQRLLETENPYFQRLITANNQGENRLINYSNHFKYLLEDEETAVNTSPNSIHLYENAIISSEKGKYVVRKNELNNIKHISESISFKVNQDPRINEFPNWSVLKKTKLPISAAIISDPFIIRNYKGWRFNLFEIIKNILPNNLNVDFHLTIVSKGAKPLNHQKDEIKRETKEKIEKIESFLGTLNCNYKIKLGLIEINSGEKHDRMILTNYFRVVSGDSFNYYRGSKLSKDTTLDIHPLNNNPGVTYFKELETFKNLLENSKDEDLFGFCDNRLLS